MSLETKFFKFDRYGTDFEEVYVIVDRERERLYVSLVMYSHNNTFSLTADLKDQVEKATTWGDKEFNENFRKVMGVIIKEMALDDVCVEIKEQQDARAAMWHEITRKNIWEGYVTIKQSALKAATEHRGYSQSLVNTVWERCVANSAAYKQPRVSYLLEAFGFEGERLLLDKAFASKEEQVIYAIFEHVKKG